MNQPAEQDRHQALLARVSDALEAEQTAELRSLLGDEHPADVALLLESLPSDEREIIWDELDPELHAEVLAEVDDEVRARRLRRMQPEVLAELAQSVDTDDAADILQDLPEDVADEVLLAMDEQNRERVASVLHYPEDTAGGLMNLDVLTVRADVSLEVVVRFLRRRGEIPEKTNRLFVVDRDARYAGMLRLADLLIQSPEDMVHEHIIDEQDAIAAETPAHEVARLFEQHNLISAPVVDDKGRLIGRITIDDVVDVIRDEGDNSFMRMAGLDADVDIFAPVLSVSRRRTVWLGVNLATAFLAAWVIALFENALEQLVALAVLMPVVASMGGIAGSQTLTVVIRGLALGQVGYSNAGWLIGRELLVGLINSVFWAVVVALIVAQWFGVAGLGVVIAVALVVTLVVAAFTGAVLPLVLRRMSIDPALAGGVILTTVTDVVGFMTFLGLGALFLI